TTSATKFRTATQQPASGSPRKMSHEQGSPGSGLAAPQVMAADLSGPPQTVAPTVPAGAGIVGRPLRSWGRFQRSMPLAALIIQRLGLSAVLLWAVSVVIFLGIEALPGDFAQTYLGQSATP